MECCELIYLISSMANILSQGKNADEIALMGAFFSQLGDTLSTIAACKELK